MSSTTNSAHAHETRSARLTRRSLLRGQDDLESSTTGREPTLGSSKNQEVPDSASIDREDLPLEDVHEDDTCPICRLLLHNPVTTTCNHTLCNFCMATWASVSLQAPMTIVDVDEEPVAFDAVSELQARCPMCRTLTSAAANGPRTAELQAKYPQTWAERAAEAETEGAGGEGIQTMTVCIGNRHARVAALADDAAANQHDWTFFVRPSREDVIEEIHIYLHPTFLTKHIICQRAPYQVSRRGWGTFTVTASVILKAGYSWLSDDAQDSPDGAEKGMLPLEWTLDFEGFGGRGSMGRCRLKVKHDRGWEDVSDEEQRDTRERNRMIRQYERDGRYEPR